MADRLTAEEQEVCINFDRVDDVATIYVSDTRWIKKMDKLAKQYPEAYVCVSEAKVDGIVVGKTYTFPQKLISLRKPNKSLSEEEKANRRKNLKNNT